MDNTARFTGRADVYAKARPGYAEALIEELTAWAGLSPASTVADIGAGTGISAQLASTGARVIAVEPNDDMRAEAEKRFAGASNVSVLAGTAEATGIEDASVDLVTAAQAFRWFDCEAFRAECPRILRAFAVSRVHNFNELAEGDRAVIHGVKKLQRQRRIAENFLSRRRVEFVAGGVVVK